MINGWKKGWKDPSENGPSTPTTEFYSGAITGDPTDKWWPSMWAPRAIGAPAAWAQGINGKCVRVAVVDGYFGPLGPDTERKFDMTVSRFETEPFVDGWDIPHGQWVSGVIGAEANNGKGTIGVAYGATLIAVQTLDGGGSGTISDIVKGILYAAERKDKGGAGADIINLSLGGIISKPPKTKPGSRTRQEQAQDVSTILTKSLLFADKKGVFVVAAAGNTNTDLDVQRASGQLQVPCEGVNVVCVSAFAPISMCKGDCIEGITCAVPLDFGGANYSRKASYSNYGTAIDISAPGGDLLDPGTCWINDMVATTDTDGYTTWQAGTSFASPHVAAAAALYIHKAVADSRRMSSLCSPTRTKTLINPDRIKNAIRRGAVVPPGDPTLIKRYFGAGLLNIPSTLRK
ncbi:hypothetical protein HYH03_018611 [Edaphochlamys debaryana]|nr:hypothetical protein HYH03_018611 [Edaphochlamys debaryana]|eukprot:KAG2482441.1 hypothetical protein HYH03_018611 [Edaphochlamys debaryana]